MNLTLLKEIERQLFEVIGILALDIPSEQNTMARQQLVTMVHGLRIITQACEMHPMTLGELEQAQFDKATEMSEWTTPEENMSLPASIQSR